MTATPDKRDDDVAGRNIYEIFNYQIAYEIRLQQVMEEDILCPFHYFGISDVSLVEEKQLKSRKMYDRDINLLTGDERVRHIIEQAEYYGYSGDRVKGLIFCSRIDESEELSQKFNALGYRTIALNGRASEDERTNAFERLAMDEKDATENMQPLDYIFSVEILKDGWEFPGGKIEEGETPQEALVREIKEELDTEIEVMELLDTVEYDYPNFHLSMDCYICRIVSGDLVLKEHEASKWLTKETLWSVEWLPADLELVSKIEKNLNLVM